jgi:hypothetical protein
MWSLGTVVTSLLMVASIDLSAQTWCRPGATWYYNGLDNNGGYVKVTYRADTLIDGMEAQVLDRTQVVLNTEGLQDTLYAPVHMITRHDGDLVELRIGTTWRTLYNFAGTTGYQWHCFTVTGHGTEVLNGQVLRWQNIGPVHKIYERIGYIWHIDLACAFPPVLQPAALRCYSDNEFSVQFGPLPCEGLVGVQELGHRVLPVHPNPGISHFTLELPPGPHIITLFDTTGRMVLQQRTTDERPVIGTEALPAGLYRIAVRDERGGVMGASWVKER